MWDLLMQWMFAVLVCSVCFVFVRAMVRVEGRRLAKMTEQERYEEWLDMQW